jgi:hypothetical protein
MSYRVVPDRYTKAGLLGARIYRAGQVGPDYVAECRTVADAQQIVALLNAQERDES